MQHDSSTADGPFVQNSAAHALKGSRADRRYRRIVLRVPVRFVLPDKRSREGQLIDMSVRGASIAAPPGAIVGDDIELFVPDVGQLRGKVAGLHQRGFGVSLHVSKDERVFLADALTVILHPKVNESRAVRFAQGAETVLETMDGDSGHCRIDDLSATGASLTTAMTPAIGEWVRVGRKKAVVVRHFDGGLAIAFKASLSSEVRK